MLAESSYYQQECIFARNFFPRAASVSCSTLRTSTTTI